MSYIVLILCFPCNNDGEPMSSLSFTKDLDKSYRLVKVKFVEVKNGDMMVIQNTFT